MPVLQLLVASYLPGDVTPARLRQTVRASRERAASLGLTGSLLFDGEKFVQLFVGPEPVARAALAALRADAAHERVNGLHATEAIADNPWRDWRVGYTEPALLDAVLDASERGMALHAFEQALRQIDLS